jgi:nonsense-mediated mRNA decay protein 3
MRFCFLCGKNTDELVKGYCDGCYKKQFNLIEVPKEIIVTTCPRCNKKFEHNKWKDADVSDLVRNMIKVLGSDVTIAVEVDDKTVRLVARGYLEGSRNLKEEHHEIKMKVIKNTCPTCSKESSKYYESTIQVRGKMTDDDFDAMDDIAFKRGGYFKVKEVKGGYDFSVGDKSVAKAMADHLVKKYRIDLKKSFKLITKKDGRDLYRDTILLRTD